jgi:hypothetical protein
MTLDKHRDSRLQVAGKKLLGSRVDPRLRIAGRPSDRVFGGTVAAVVGAVELARWLPPVRHALRQVIVVAWNTRAADDRFVAAACIAAEEVVFREGGVPLFLGLDLEVWVAVQERWTDQAERSLTGGALDGALEVSEFVERLPKIRELEFV